MKKAFVTTLVAIMVVALLLAGCQTPAPAPSSAAPVQSSAAPAQTSAAAAQTSAAAQSASAAVDFKTMKVPTDEAGRDALRQQLAQQYKNANPGESFLVGHITFQLDQEYTMMVLQATKQACDQLGLKFQSMVATSDAEWVQDVESLIASGAKAITLNCPSLAAMPEIVKLANEHHVFIATFFGYSGDMFPGDLGPYWVVDNTPLSDEQTYLPLTVLMEKMKENGKTKLLHIQASKTAATVSTVYINLGVYQAWQKYPEIQVLGHQYGEWDYEHGSQAAQAALANRTDYDALWGANDSQTTGALKVLGDRGINIGPYTASRDMEMTTAQDIIDGNFLCTAGFAIPYCGGRLVPMLYDMCVGSWYPLPDEFIQAGRIDVYGNDELAPLAKNSGVDQNPSWHSGPTQDNLDKILTQMKAENPQYPYDFRLMSLSKCKELSLTYDRNAGGGTALGQHDYYFPASTQKFGTMDALRKHVAALYKYFLDFSWADTLDKAQEYAKQFPPELKLDPVWK